MSRNRLVLLSSTLLLAACSRQSPAPVSSAPPITPAAAHGTTPATPAGQSVSGPVLETMDAASYTYVRVRGASGEVWAAAPQFAVKVGDRVRVPLEMPMANFHSQSLNRDFPLIYFVSGITPENGGASASAATTTAGPPIDVHGTPRPAASATTMPPMPPPAGGMTIGRLWTDRKQLGGKTVTVRGVVMKYNPGILGRNWIHLQDGTGNAADGSHDITVTTADDVKIGLGDVLTVTGTAVLDKNLGEGYAYPIVIENARISTAKGTN